MSDNQHVSKDDLLEMLESENDSPHVNRIGEHLHNCTSCRNKLDSLAAQSVVWEKAPEMLNSDIPIRAGLSSTGLETQEHPLSGKPDSDPAQWSWPIESILDPPRHPEMLGRIGDYDIEREIGCGGMGIVLKAHEAELNRPLAIKVLAPHLASHGTARQRFAKEARAAAGVIHPNVIAVHRVDSSGKVPYIVMPYIAGPSMQDLVEDNGPLAEEEIVRMALQIAAGLTAAHSQGLVHRDIKPANILVADGGNRVMITDFGLARAEDDASLTRTGWLTGTPNYMSPEQTKGARLDHRSDLFSLGSLIYFLATGRLPFRSESPLGVLRRIQEDQPTPVRQVNRNISKTLADIIDVLLEKDPADRFQSAADLHDVLSRQMFFLHQPDISHPPVVKKELAKPKLSEKFIWGGLIGAAGLAALSFFMIAPGLLMQEDEKPRQEEADTPVQVQTARVPKITDSNLSDADLEAIIDAVSEVPLKPKMIEKSTAIATATATMMEERDEEMTDAQRAFEKGWEQIKAKEYAAAVESFELASRHDELKGISLYNAGCSYALMGKTEKSLLNLEMAIDEGFDSYGQYKEDADLESLREDDRFKDILADLKEIHQARGQLADAIDEINDEHYAEAVKIIEGVMEIDPNNEKAWLNFGYALHMQENYNEALKWHIKTAAGKEHVALGNYNTACVYAIRKMKDDAFASLEAALEHDLALRLGKGHLENDSDLDNLRDDERFDDFVERYNEAAPKWITSISEFVDSAEHEECEECEKESEECEECADAMKGKEDSAGSVSDEPVLEEPAESEGEEPDAVDEQDDDKELAIVQF